MTGYVRFGATISSESRKCRQRAAEQRKPITYPILARTNVKDKVTPEVASEQKSAELTEGREVRTEATLDSQV